MAFGALRLNEENRQGMYANIIIDISHEMVDKTFQYRVPMELKGKVSVGTQVEIPFGPGNRLRKGYVVELTETAEFDIGKIKDIAGVAVHGVTAQSRLIQVAWWLKERYGSTMNQALKTVLPVKQKVKQRQARSIRRLLSEEETHRAAEEAARKHYGARERLLRALAEAEEIPYQVAVNQMNLTMASIKPMAEMGMIALESETVFRNPVIYGNLSKGGVELNPGQRAVAEDFCRRYDRGIRETALLYGVTGSGKTEVYMEMIAHVLEAGRQVIVLIPEIALTYQTVLRFCRRFGSLVSIINSRMSAGERYDQFERAKSGQVRIMIGPRSALFTPFSDLGLIIVDEEHETAYKSEISPRYHAREVAGHLAGMCGASVVLGSATPSLESYTKALAGQWRLYRLKQRAKKDSRMAQVRVVDLREELLEGNRSIFSRTLREAVEARLGAGQQTMLFMNRRGYASFVSCRSCGEAVKCPHCDVTLTLHFGQKLVCHYCGYEAKAPDRCPRCSSPYIAGFGTGTQKVEEITKKMFPKARVLRMDMDTTSKKGGHEEILAAFAGGQADILIGTQMIVKGHDFPKVTLVGVLAADLSLYTPDFRCGERTFQLLTQAAGRAGRDELAGEVVIQTYNPEHYSIVCAARQDYESFYQKEMVYRDMLHYPPEYQLLAVMASSRSQETLEQAMGDLSRWAREETGRWGKGNALEFVHGVGKERQNAPGFGQGAETEARKALRFAKGAGAEMRKPPEFIGETGEEVRESPEFIGETGEEVRKPPEFIGETGEEMRKPLEFIGETGEEVRKPPEFIRKAKAETDRDAQAALGFVAQAGESGGQVEMIGPAQAPIYKVNDIYRKILYLKHENYDILIKLRNYMEQQSRQAPWHPYVMVQHDFA